MPLYARVDMIIGGSNTAENECKCTRECNKEEESQSADVGVCMSTHTLEDEGAGDLLHKSATVLDTPSQRLGATRTDTTETPMTVSLRVAPPQGRTDLCHFE